MICLVNKTKKVLVWLTVTRKKMKESKTEVLEDRALVFLLDELLPWYKTNFDIEDTSISYRRHTMWVTVLR